MKVINYKASNFKGDCYVREDFAKKLDIMNTVLVRYGMTAIITSSGRKVDKKVKNAIVKPAKLGNHFVYGAIDFNLYHKATNTYYNSTKLGDGLGQDDLCCKQIIIESGLRWGNAFQVKDSVHMDDSLNITNPAEYTRLYNLYQK